MTTSEVPIQPISLDAHGVLRFLPNTLVQRLLDHCRGLPGPYRLDLNALALESHPQGDREQLAMLLGYSLAGFAELSYVSDETHARVLDAAPPLTAEEQSR